MFTRHISSQLAAHLDGELSPEAAAQTVRHAAQCADCRAQLEQVQYAMNALDHLALVEPPDAIWTSIEAALQQHRPSNRSAARQWRLAFAATLILTLAGAAYWTLTRQVGTRWDVA